MPPHRKSTNEPAVRQTLVNTLVIHLQGPQQTELSRDFTYVDDIVEGVIASLTHIPPSKPGSAQYKVRAGSLLPLALVLTEM